jgi:hypothetical protein
MILIVALRQSDFSAPPAPVADVSIVFFEPSATSVSDERREPRISEHQRSPF